MKKKISLLNYVASLIQLIVLSFVLALAFRKTENTGMIFVGVLAFSFLIGFATRHIKGKNGILYDLTITDTTYAGTVEAAYMITQATFGMDTVNKGVAYVKDGIKKQHNIPKVDITKVLQPRQATPTSQGTFTVTGVVIHPQDVMAYTEFNPRDFEDHFYAEQLSKTLLARELPVTAENVMMQLFLNRCFEQIENGVHMGSLGYTTVDPTNANFQIKYWDGYIRKALVDGTYIPVPSPSAITAANILTKFNVAYNLLPIGVLADSQRYSKVKFIVSIVDQLLYEEALTTQTFKNNDTTEKGINKYKGYEVVGCAGVPKDTFYCTRAYLDIESNLWIGTNSTEDLTLELKKVQNNSELFYFKALFKFDTQIAKMNELVMHTTHVASDFTV